MASGSSSQTSGFHSGKSGSAYPSPYPCSTLPSYPSSPRTNTTTTKRKPRRAEHKSSCKRTISTFIPSISNNYNHTVPTDPQNSLCTIIHPSNPTEMHKGNVYGWKLGICPSLSLSAHFFFYPFLSDDFLCFYHIIL